MPREAMTRDAMLRPPPRVERQRRETVTEEAGAPHLPDAGPALRPSFELAARVPPAPEPKRTPAPRLPQRAAQDDESILAEMALRLQTALGGRSSRSFQRSRRVLCHLMFGILALTWDQLLRLIV